ncbi:uncharacterized protein [Ovis canadensis]|uniref:uncharacterized protein isoform X5 n=1 Tax=Ovis canadensis TaxID=37174 RepID=UPI003752B9CD
MYRELIHSFTQARTRKLIHSFTQAYMQELIHSFTQAYTWELIHSFTQARTRKLIHSFTQAHTRELIHSFTQAYTWELIHSFTQARTRKLIHSLRHTHENSFIHSLRHTHGNSFIHSLRHTHGNSFIHSLRHAHGNSFIHSLRHTHENSFIDSLRHAHGSSSIHSLRHAHGSSSIHSLRPARRSSSIHSLGHAHGNSSIHSLGPAFPHNWVLSSVYSGSSARVTLPSITESDQSLSPAPKHRPRLTNALFTAPRARLLRSPHVPSTRSRFQSGLCPRAALAWGPAREASANIDFGGGVLKAGSFRARTPQTPGFRGEAAEGAGRGVRSARLRALNFRGPQLGHQAGRAAGAGRAGDPRPGAELTSRRAARLWAAPRPAHPGPATAGARRPRTRSGWGPWRRDDASAWLGGWSPGERPRPGALGRVVPTARCAHTMPVSDQAFVTLATNDVYCQGALVLGQSLREHGATRRLVVLLTPQVSTPLRVILSRVFDEVIEVNLIDSADYVHLAFLKRPDLGITLTKLHCWTLTHYSKCVFLDADTLAASPCWWIPTS